MPGTDPRLSCPCGPGSSIAMSCARMHCAYRVRAGSHCASSARPPASFARNQFRDEVVARRQCGPVARRWGRDVQREPAVAGAVGRVRLVHPVGPEATREGDVGLVALRTEGLCARPGAGRGGARQTRHGWGRRTRRAIRKAQSRDPEQEARRHRSAVVPRVALGHRSSCATSLGSTPRRPAPAHLRLPRSHGRHTDRARRRRCGCIASLHATSGRPAV